MGASQKRGEFFYTLERAYPEWGISQKRTSGTAPNLGRTPELFNEFAV